jgi:hypothetical protein
VCIQACEKRWTTGTVYDIKKESEKIFLTEEKVQNIEAWLQISHLKSLRCLTQETGILLESAFTATKLFGIHPCNISYAWTETARLCSKNSFLLLQNVYNGMVDPQLLLLTDEVQFHVSGYVIAQNVRIWSDENPHYIQQVPLHNEKWGCCKSAVNHWPLIFPQKAWSLTTTLMV